MPVSPEEFEQLKEHIRRHGYALSEFVAPEVSPSTMSPRELQQLKMDISRRGYAPNRPPEPRWDVIPRRWVLLSVALWFALPLAAVGWTVAWALSGTLLWLLPAAVALLSALWSSPHMRKLIALLRAQPERANLAR